MLLGGATPVVPPRSVPISHFPSLSLPPLMRSLLLVPFLLGLLAVPDARAQIQFGVRAGLNVASVTGSDVRSATPRLGFHGGLVANYDLGGRASFQPGLLYSQKGATGQFSEQAEGVGGDSFEFSIDYLDIPLLFGYDVPTGTNLVARLSAGPQLSLKIWETVSLEGAGLEFDLMRGSDLSLVVGADVGALRVGSRQAFGLGLRYALGLTNMLDSGLMGSTRTGNQVFAVSAFYTF
jgi:hypothetical protein